MSEYPTYERMNQYKAECDDLRAALSTARAEAERAREVVDLVQAEERNTEREITANLIWTIEQLRDENAKLKERLGPRGLEVVEINGAGHYVNEKVKLEIDDLRKRVKGLDAHPRLGLGPRLGPGPAAPELLSKDALPEAKE